ncbi:MAG: hypothetical protein M1830_010079, partial [Pleopsidium flavum]
MPPKEVRTTGDKSSDKRKAKAGQQPPPLSDLTPPFRPAGTAAGSKFGVGSARGNPSLSAQSVTSDTERTPSSAVTSAATSKIIPDSVVQSQSSQESRLPVSAALTPSTLTPEAPDKSISSTEATEDTSAASRPSSASACTTPHSSTGKTKSAPLSSISETSISLSGFQSKANKGLGAPKNDEFNDARSSLAQTLGSFDKPRVQASEASPIIDMSHKQFTLPLQSNCYSVDFPETLYRYEIICEPLNVLAKKEKRLLEKAFLQEFCIEPHKGSVAFLDGHTFLTSKLYQGLENCVLVGTINRRLEKPDGPFKPIYLERESGEGGQVIKAWSSFTKGFCFGDEFSRKDTLYRNEDPKIGSQIMMVRASAAVKELDPEALLELLSKPSNPSAVAQYTEALSCLSISNNPERITLLNALNSPSLVVHGNKVFDFTWPEDSLGYGLESRTGVNHDIRTTHKDLIRAILPCHRVFYSPIKVSNFIAEHLPGLAFTSSKAIDLLRTLLRGLRVQVQRSQRKTRFATISGIAETRPSETFFELMSAGGHRTTNVADYFTKDKATPLTYSNHPCLIIGSEERPQFIPTCICEILPGQSFRNPIPKDALVKFNEIKANCSWSPSGNDKLANVVSQAMPLSGLCLHDTIGNKQFSLSPEQVACRKMVKIAAPGPDAAKIYSKNKFRIIFVEVGNAPAMSKTMDLFLGIFKRQLRDLNLGESLIDGNTLILKQSASIDSWQKDMDKLISADTTQETPDKACDRDTNTPAPFVLAFIGDGRENKQTYRKLKHVCDLDLGWQSCCVKLSTLDKLHRKNTDSGVDNYAYFLLRKMLAKSANNPYYNLMPLPNATLLVGAHVAEASEGSTKGKEVQVNDAQSSHVYCITLASKPNGHKGTYKTTTLLKRAIGPDALGLEILLKAHLDEHEKARVQISTLSRIVFYRSGLCTAGKLSPSEKLTSCVQFPPEVRLPQEKLNQLTAPRGRTGAVRASSLDPPHQKEATGEKEGSGNNTEKNGIRHSPVSNEARRRSTTVVGLREQTVNGASIRTPSNTPSLPPYAENDSTARRDRFWAIVEREKLLQKEVDRLESTIKPKYPGAKLFYISVGKDTKLRLYNADEQALEKEST